MLLTSACEETVYTVPNRTIITDVNARGWVTYDSGKTYEVKIDLPEYDNYYHEEGAILVYASFGDSGYEQVPQVFDGISYSYIAFRGRLTIQIQDSDAFGEVTPPSQMRLKIVLIDSQY